MESDYLLLEDQVEVEDLEKKMSSTFANCTVLTSNVTQICPVTKLGNSFVVVGCEDGKVCVVGKNVEYLKGHTLQVRRVLVTPDKNFAVTSSRDKTVKLWNLSTNLEHSSYDCGSDVVSIAIHSDTILAGCENGNVFTIDLQSSTLLKLEGHSEMIRWVAFGANGQNMYSLSNDKTIKVYSNNGQVLGQLQGHEGWVNRIDFTQDGLWAVTGSTDNKAILWNLENLSIDTVFEAHTDQIWSVAVSSNNKWAATGSNDFSVCIWNLEQKTLHCKLTGHTHQVPHIKISKDCRFVVSGSFDKTVKIWNIEGQSLEVSFEGHTHFVRCVEFSEDEDIIYSGGADKSLRKWGLSKKVTTSVFNGHTDWIRRLATVPGTDKFVSAGKDKTVRLWSIKNGLEHTFIGHKDEVWGLAVTPDGQYAVSGSHDKTVKLWNLSTRSLEHTFEGHENWVTFVFITPDSHYAVTPSHDSTIGVWDLLGRCLVTRLQGHTGAVVRLALSEDGKTIYSSSRDKSVRMWDLASGTLLASFTEHTDLILALAVSKNNLALVTGCNDKTLRFYNPELKVLTGSVAGAHGGDINRIVITPDCLLAVSASDDKTIKIWDLQGLCLKWVMEGHTNIVTWIEMTSDGKHVVSASRDKTVKVWDLSKTVLEVSYDNHTDVLYSLAITSDNQHVVSGSFDKSIGVHKLHSRRDVQSRLHGVYNGSLEAAGRILDYKNKPFSADLQPCLIFPLHVNILHLYAYTDKQSDMVSALEANTAYFASSRYGSPMLLAIQRNNFEIINAIIEYFIRISTDKPVRFDIFGTLKADLPELLKIRLRSIGELLTNLPLIGNRTDLIKYIGFDAKLPEIVFSDMHEFSGTLFEFQSQNKTLVQVNYYAVPFRVNLETGSRESLELLNQLESSPNSNLFVSRFVAAIIDYKWRRLRIFFILEFLNYAIYLIMMCMYLGKSDQGFKRFIFILALNTSCFTLEILQMLPSALGYFRSMWNVLDLVRILGCYIMIIFILINPGEDIISEYRMVQFKIILMILCWVKGISYFRMFDLTRYFVTMLSDILVDSLGFTTIFFYSIMSFANLFELNLNSSTSSYWSMFEATFETIFGGGSILENSGNSKNSNWLIFFFATLIVTVIMLNLLISLFGDTFDRVQMECAETSNRIRINMILEIENMLFWKRNRGSEKYMVVCDRVEAESGDWEGKVKAIVKEITVIEKNQNDYFRTLIQQVSDHKNQNALAIQALEKKIDILISKK